jgi:hypothetical protein
MPITITRTKAAVLAFAAAAAIADTAVAATPAPSPLHEHHASEQRTPRVLPKGGSKLLSLEQATRLQRRAQRTGRIPAAPRFAKPIRGSAEAPRRIHTNERPGPVEGQRVPITKGRPLTKQPQLFGFHGAYATKKWALVNWVNYTYSVVLGSSFRQPSVYETTYVNGCGPVHNASMCWGNMNVAAFNPAWSQDIFDRYGDAGFAAVMAHEYGHGAMSWLGFAGRGSFNHQIFREGFADCMAGAWLYWMSANRHTDNVGRGDRQELYDLMYGLGSSNSQTLYTNHGDAGWRTALSTYGWNTGFNGCIAYGRRLAAGYQS